jgi:hypothetical protein
MERNLNMKMKMTAQHWLRHALVVAAAAVLTGCVDQAPVGPYPGSASPSLASSTASTEGVAALTGADSGDGVRSARLGGGGCDIVNVPAGSKLAFHAFAQGVQIYSWNGTSWSFVAPEATLFADSAGSDTVATHFAGPTWQGVDGSKVVGTSVLQRCTRDPNAIPWLLLRAASTDGPGIFRRLKFIQRVKTAGGNAPADAGSVIGEEARVPYTAEYLFWTR